MYTVCVKEIGDVWFSVAFGGDERMVASSFSYKGRKDVVAKIIESLPSGSSFTEAEPKGMALDILRDMHLIHEGKPVEREFKFDMDRLPPFTRKVLLMTYRIPRGFAATYGGIAKAIGDEGAARAVGNVERRNPFGPIVPCHRVVGSDLGLGGYGGGYDDLDVKRAILEREGVVLIGERISKESLWVPRG